MCEQPDLDVQAWIYQQACKAATNAKNEQWALVDRNLYNQELIAYARHQCPHHALVKALCDALDQI